MSQYKYAEIADTVYFWFAANETTGTAGDGADPLYDVRLAGAAADAAPTASGSPTLLSHANYGAGLYEIAIDTTGYSAGEYAVFCTLTISTVNPGGFVGSFKLRTAGTPALKVDTIAVAGTVQSATDLKDFADTGYDPSTHKVQGVVLADTATTLTNLPAVTADWLTAAGVKADAVAKIQNGLATPTNITAGTITTVTNLTNAPTNGDLTATMKTSVQTAADAAVTANTKIVAIEADTNEVQAELADGGRTDLLIDAIKAITDQINFTGTDVNANASVALTEGDISDIADGVAAAIKLTTGWTAGGTLTYAEVVKIIAAAVAGKVIDKAGVAGTVQHLDVEDGTTPILENIPSNTTSPYRDTTVL